MKRHVANHNWYNKKTYRIFGGRVHEDANRFPCDLIVDVGVDVEPKQRHVFCVCVCLCVPAKRNRWENSGLCVKSVPVHARVDQGGETNTYMPSHACEKNARTKERVVAVFVCEGNTRLFLWGRDVHKQEV